MKEICHWTWKAWGFFCGVFLSYSCSLLFHLKERKTFSGHQLQFLLSSLNFSQAYLGCFLRLVYQIICCCKREPLIFLCQCRLFNSAGIGWQQK